MARPSTSFSPSSESSSESEELSRRLMPWRTSQSAPTAALKFRGTGDRSDKRRVGSVECSTTLEVAEPLGTNGAGEISALGSGVGDASGGSRSSTGQRGQEVPQRRLPFLHCSHVKRPRLGRPRLFLGVSDSRASASPAASPVRPSGQSVSGGTWHGNVDVRAGACPLHKKWRCTP